MQANGCRICSGDLTLVLDLGVQPLSGVFPKPGEEVETGPLELMRCEACGLVQLAHDCPLSVWGESYGYRSGLNQAMVRHLKDIADHARQIADLQPGDLVLDIGSNDGTLLGHFDNSLQRVGFDPLAEKFREFTPPDVRTYDGFFSAEAMQRAEGGVKAKVVTTIACFYDLAEPLRMVNDILEVLADDGIWISEQSYLPSMVKARSFDTICHEHLEYYMLRDFAKICEFVGLEIIGVTFDDTNGGSFRVTMCRPGAGPLFKNTIHFALSWERHWRHTDALGDFADWVPGFRDRLQGFFHVMPGEVYGYGASTKGNVLLNYCHITRKNLPVIADVNPDKWGRVTPGSRIPIVPEEEAKALFTFDDGPISEKAFFVLPWHFRDAIVERELEFLKTGGVLWFPLPEHEFVY
jgi:hypothetical protein